MFLKRPHAPIHKLNKKFTYIQVAGFSVENGWYIGISLNKRYTFDKFCASMKVDDLPAAYYTYTYRVQMEEWNRFETCITDAIRALSVDDRSLRKDVRCERFAEMVDMISVLGYDPIAVRASVHTLSSGPL